MITSFFFLFWGQTQPDVSRASKERNCLSLDLWKKSLASFDLCCSTQSSAFIKLWPVSASHLNAVIRLFAALTTMGGLLAWRQQITSRKRDERESFPNFPPPASLCQQAASRHSCLMNANLCWKIWEGRILSSCFFAERWPVLLPPKKDIAAAGASVIY